MSQASDATKAATFRVCEQTLTLLPERAIFWEEQQYLLLADPHLGKAGHFRKNGIPIPASVHWKDLEILDGLIRHLSPRAVVILGDLFHSAINNEWQDFEDWLATHRDLPFVLVKGNHDILPEVAYQLPNLTVHPEKWLVTPFIFTHKPIVEPVQSRGGLSYRGQTGDCSSYNLSGHIHPGMQVKIGMGQSVKLPCFYFSSCMGLLPAFGQFTGCAVMRPGVDDRVFAVVEDRRVVAVGGRDAMHRVFT